VKSDPQNAWATASLCYCRLQLTADAEWEKRLARMARGCAPTDRASCLHRRTMPYAGFLPDRVGPGANLLRELLQKGSEVLAKELPKRYRLKVHDVEPPSVRLAFDQQMESMGIDCRLELQVGHIRTPDPRRPIGVVQHALWRYEGDIAYPSLPAPGEDVARGIARLARQPYDPERNWRMAGVVAEAVGIQRADELMGVMVCPPPLPADMNALVWIPRIQLAAAQTLAQTDTAWEGSMRRQMLFDVALGPVDWTTEMAIIALCQLIQREPAIYDDVRKVFHDLLQHFRSATDDPYRLALLTNWLAIPTLPTEERRQLTELLIPLKTK
jgi:hypothetical protein